MSDKVQSDIDYAFVAATNYRDVYSPVVFCFLNDSRIIRYSFIL